MEEKYANIIHDNPKLRNLLDACSKLTEEELDILVKMINTFKKDKNDNEIIENAELAIKKCVETIIEQDRPDKSKLSIEAIPVLIDLIERLGRI